MKKIVIFTIIFLSVFLIGCDFLSTTSSTSNTTESATSSVTTQSSISTTSTSLSDTTTTTTNTVTEPDVINMSLNAGQDTVEINTVWVDAGAICTINDVNFNASTADVVDTSKLGLTQVEYVYEYSSKMYSIIRYVLIVDQTAPEISLNLGVDTIVIGGNWVDGGASASDNSLETITITVEGTVDISIAGTYQIIYIAEDSSGNVSQITRFVTVINPL